MTGAGSLASRFVRPSRLLGSLNAHRNTWVLHRVYAPEPTAPGALQRNPAELPSLQKLAVTDFETKRSAGPLQVILLQDVEGVGHQFDVVEVDRKYARTDLLLSKKAVYASPFDLAYYAEMKERMADELAARVRIPFELLSVGRDLQKIVVPIKVSMENKWTLNSRIIKASLRQVGVDLLDDCIFVPEPAVSGPNFEMEAKLLRFYVVVNNSFIVPMLGRVSHISVDESKQIISPESSRAPTAADLAKHGIQKEEPVYSKAAEFTSDFPVVDFMRSKARLAKQHKMVLESTMLCVDNSEFMRNGDFAPTRLQCQQDAANMIIQAKLRSNPENAVGLLSMGSEVQVHSTMTQEHSRLFMKLHQIEPKGLCNFLAGIKVAHLALKHRQNRSHRMRVVLFVGSPIDNVDSAELIKVAKKFKKEKVECDVICFGEADSNNSKLMGQFVDVLNGKEGSGSNLVVVPSGTPLTEALNASQICRGEDGGNAAAGGGAGFEFGIDPEEDPDLALALRVSMEEERARQAAAAATAEGGAAAAPAAEPQPDVVDMDMAAMTEEEQLEWALRMSMQQDAPAPAAAPQEAQAAESMDVDVTTNDDNVDDLINNPELLQQIVNDLPAENKKKEDESK